MLLKAKANPKIESKEGKPNDYLTALKIGKIFNYYRILSN